MKKYEVVVEGKKLVKSFFFGKIEQAIGFIEELGEKDFFPCRVFMYNLKTEELIFADYVE